MELKFSVVIPFYNSNSTLSRTLESVLRQGVPVEILISNDGSAEDPMEIVQRYTGKSVSARDSQQISNPPEIKVIDNVHQGVSHARNQGWRNATFDYVAFIDSDDEWKEGFLSTISKMITEFPEAGMYCTNRDHRKSDGSDAITKRFSLVGVPPESTPWMGILDDYFVSAQGRPPVHSSSVVIRKDILTRTGGFDERASSAEDMDLWARIALISPVAFCNQRLAIYHIPANPLQKYRHTSFLDYRFYEEAKIVLTEKHLTRGKALSLVQYLDHFKLMLIRLMIVGGHLTSARRELSRLVFVRGFRLRIVLAWSRYLKARISESLNFSASL